MGWDEKELDELTKLLPEGWEQKAKELGAITRVGKIKTARDLLLLNLLYLTEAQSFGKTSALLKIGGILPMNKNAVYERIIKSEQWLLWMCQTICRNQQVLVDKPAWLTGKDVCLIDASDEPVHGSDQADYRLHYCVELFSLCMKEMKFTETKQGEKLVNFEKLGADDVVVADRAYGTIQGIEYMGARKGDYVLRLRANAFNLYDGNQNKVELLSYLPDLGEYESGSVDLYYKLGEEYKPLRVCATRKSAESERAGITHLKKSNNKKMRGKVSEAQELYNRYIIVATSLGKEVAAKSIMELYRMRWQVEIVFKELKSLFGYNKIPSKLEHTARSWFYGKLLLAALCETVVNVGNEVSAGVFSPCGDGDGGGRASGPAE
jgi:hypothetical protein